MGSKRVGLARAQALIENLKRELNLQGTTLTGADTSGQANAITAAHGAGLISTEIAPRHYRYQAPDGTFVNTIEVDLTGLKHSNVVGDAIGLAAGAAVVTKYVASTFGILYKVEVICLELPTASSNPCLDFDLLSATAADKVFDNPIGDEADVAAVFTMGGNVALGKTTQSLTPAQPDADGDVIYLTVGAAPGGADTHTAGKLLIKFYGSPTF